MTLYSDSEAPDYSQIVSVINDYVEGWQAQASKFRRAFDEHAWIFYTDDAGNLSKGLLADLFDRWASTHWRIRGRILSVTQIGDLANVVLHFENLSQPSASFYDSHTLLKVDGEWRITNKTAVHAPTD